jgi:hypothetical protein
MKTQERNKTMKKHIYHYRFARTIPAREIEETLMLAVIAVESLHGRARLTMDGRYRFDKAQHLCEIDATTEVGMDLARIFTGYVTREYGDISISIDLEFVPAESAGKCACAAAGRVK